MVFRIVNSESLIANRSKESVPGGGSRFKFPQHRRCGRSLAIGKAESRSLWINLPRKMSATNMPLL